MRSRFEPHAWTLLIALLAVVLLNGALIAGLAAFGVPPGQALHQTAPGRSAALANLTGNDSWKPMARAQRAFQQQPDVSLYRVFFEDHIKFQYPPSALFVLDLFPARWFDGPDSLDPGKPMNQLLTWTSRAAFALTLLLCVLLYLRGKNTSSTWVIAVCGALLGVMFYPLVRAHILGQIQIYIDCLVAAGLLAYMAGWRALAGACIGICCLIKPQYGLILLWGVLRRDWRFSVGLIAVAGVGFTASLLRYGLANHLEYLKVLSYISQHGEAYWPNQSVNGVLNRLLDNGDALHFDRYSFPPYNPVVYFGTLLSSLAIMVTALWPTRGRTPDALDLAIALLGATLAAPVAWEHHYGILLSVFAIAATRVRSPLLLASYLMAANALLRPSWLLGGPVRELLASHLFFGALLLFVILVSRRAKLQPPLAAH